MSIYIDADAIVRWEKGEFDLPGWLSVRHGDTVAIPATVWQQVQFGVFAWIPERAAKRRRFLEAIGQLPVIPFSRTHAERAAALAAELKLQQIGFADFQIAAAVLEDGAELLTFNRAHFSRVPRLQLAEV
jgi:predicted nucleic acid-binding protein